MTCMKIAIRLASADHPQQSVLELRPRLQIGAPVSRVHVADADENGRPHKSAPLFPETGLMCGTSTVPCTPSSERTPASRG